MNKIDVVIARYNENLSWCKFIDEDIKLFIYNKGDDYIDNSIKLDNIGRESDTFINHIIKNYNDINEYTIFLQGDPFFHYNKIIEFINEKKFTGGITPLSYRMEVDDIEGMPNHGGLKIKDVLEDMSIPYNMNMLFKFAAGAQYCVHREFIINKSLSWWEKLYEIHNKYVSLPGISGSPWIFERLWPLIWIINTDEKINNNEKECDII
jgi:hypothetical protein